MKPHLQCAEQQVSQSNLTKYYACHAKGLTYLIMITYETSFTMRGATGVTIQPHQILRLSPRKTRILSPHHIWNLIYNARSNRCHDPTSPNTAPATQNCIANFLTKSLKTDETAFPMQGRSENDPTMIREWSDHKNANHNPPRNRGYFSSSPRAFSIVKYIVSRPILHSNLHQVLHVPPKVTLDLHQVLHLPPKVTLELHQILRLTRKVTVALHEVLRLPRKVKPWFILITYQTSFTLRGATGVTIKPHQILRLSRKTTHILSPHHIWNLIYNARSNRCHPPTSPNAAPATKNDTAKFQRKCPKTGETSFPMRGRSENDPTMIREWSDHKNANRNPPRNRGYFSSSPRAFSIAKYNISRPILHSNLHQILHLPRKVTLDLHQVLHLPPKVTLELTLALHEVLRLPRKVTPWFILITYQTSCTMRGATGVTIKPHQILHLPRKVTLDLHQVLHLPPKVTHELTLALHEVLRLARKVTPWFILITYQTSFTMRGATGVTIKPHQILRVSRKTTHILSPHHISNLIYNARSNRCHHQTSPNTAPATKNDTAKFQRKCPKTGETSFPMRGRSENDPTMIREWSDHKNANRNPPRNRGYFWSSPRAFSIAKYNISRPNLDSNLHQILHLPRKVPLDLHQVLHLPPKVTLELTLALHEVLRLPRSDTTVLYSTLLNCHEVTQLCSTLLYSTLLYCTVL